MNTPELSILTEVSVPFEENSYIVHLVGNNECLVIDPGLQPKQIIETIESHQLTPVALLNTHGHSDHIAGNAALKERWPDCPLLIGEAEAEKLLDPNQNLSALFGFSLTSPPADVLLTDGQIYEVAGLTVQAFAIPGHSIGHMVYLVQGVSPLVVFVGDVIFSGSVGRTDFPDGDFDALANGIRDRLYRLADPTKLFPGHGPPTTVGQEKTHNPFVPAR